MFSKNIVKLKVFRETIHQLIPSYRDATIDLMDALSTNNNARSVTQLSENKFFRRKYNIGLWTSIFKLRALTIAC